MAVLHPVYTNGIDYQVVQQLRRDVAQELADYLGQHPITQAEQREYARHLIERRILSWSDSQAHAGHAPPDRSQEHAMASAVEAALFGMGRFQPLLDDDTVENIEANGCDDVWVIRRDGVSVRRVPGPPVADSDDELIEFLQQVATRSGQGDRTFSRANPLLRLRLADGSRLTAVGWVSHRPSVQIRRHRVADVDLDALVALGTVDRVLAEFLRAAVRARLNLVAPPHLRRTSRSSAVIYNYAS
jgi:pilus assembly protein CpaF